MSGQEKSEFVSFDAALRLLSLSEEGLERAVREGKLRSLRGGGQMKFLQSDIDAYLAGHVSEATFKTTNDLPGTDPGGKVTIRAIKVAQDPTATIYHVTVETPKATWTETLRTEGEVDTFLKGFQAALSMAAGDMSFRPPAIPGR